MISGRLYVSFILGAVAILAITPQAFAVTDVTISKGDSAGQDCVTAKNCYNPDVVTVATGDTVTWTNADSVSHTVTSGNPSDNQTGTIFDSSLIRPSTTYSFTFKDPGTYNYFCQVHPWMTGEVIVTAATSGTTNSNAPATSGTTNSNAPATSGTTNSNAPATSVQSYGSSMTGVQSSSGTNITITPGAAVLTSCEQTSTCFEPYVLYVTLGTTVTWKNNDIVSHDVTYGSPESSSSITTMFDSNTLAPGQTFTYQFNHPGIYPYYDKSYQWETGLVIVRPSY